MSLFDSIVASLEDVNPTAAIGEGEVSPALSEAVADVVTTGNDLISLDTGIVTTQDSVNALEETAVDLQSYLGNGGMSPLTALAVNLDIADQSRRMKHHSRNASLENFTGQDGTQVTMETLNDIKARIVKFWEMIKAAIKAAWDRLKLFIASLGKSAKALTAGGNGLIKQAGAKKAAAVKPGHEKMTSVKYAQALHNATTFDGIVSPGLLEVNRLAIAMGQTATEVAEEINKIAKDIAEKKYYRMSSILGDTVGGLGKLNNAGSVKPGTFSYKRIFGGSGTAMTHIPGGFKFHRDAQGNPQLSRDTELKLVDGTGVNFATPKVSEAQAIGEAVVAIAKSLEDYSDKKHGELESSIKKATDAIDKAVLAEGAPKHIGIDKINRGWMPERINGSNGMRNELREAIDGFNRAASAARIFSTRFNQYAAVTAKVAIGYGHAILAQYA